MGDPEKKQPAQKPRGMMETQFAAVLADAAKLFKDSSSDRGLTLDDFLTPPIKSISDLMQQLTAQNDQFSHFREKRKSIFDAVAVTLRPIELIGDIVAEGVSEAFAPAQSIFAAVMYLINAAHDVSSMYDSVLELFDQLKDFTSRLDVYLNHKLSPALREKLVTILATLFEVLVVATKVARSGRLKAYFKRLVGIESPVEPALQKLNALTLGEERQVIAETYDGVAELNLKTDKVEDLVTQMHQSILDMRLGEQQNGALSYRDKLREILEPTPYSDDSYNAFTKYRVQGTGDWLLEDEGLKSWLRGETRHLWMCGNPGTGKSFLTSRLITWGLENLPHLGYFFFSANDPETRSVLQALRDVAYQLSETDAFYAEKLAKQLHSGDDIKTVPSAFRRLFVQPFLDDARDEPSYVFLDGIDEAEQSDIEQLLSLLAPEDESEPTKVQFALTGRTYLADIVSFALDPNAVGQVFTTVYVTPDRIADDVSAFISEGVRHSRILSRSPEDFKQEVIESMKKQVDGLFILAKFMLNEINQKRHPSSILKSLKSFPKEINGMLNETLANLSVTISEEDARDLNEMLQWVSCAEESLTLEQLEAALVMKFGDAPLRLEESLRGQYACFFELEREDGLTTDDLLKDFARTQREVYPERSFRNESPRARGLTSSDTSSPGRRVSPAGRGVWSHSTSPPAAEKKMASPPRHFSPARSPGLFDMSNEVEFRSNPSTTYVTFSHTSVRQFFRDGNANGVHAMKGGVAMGFDMMTARISILKTCLRIFNDKTWFESRELDHGREAIKQYAAWYWQEHLAALDPASVPPEHKRELGMHIYSMLTVENIIYDWSAMYEKNNEGLEVFTDSNIQGLRKWLNDPAILASLTSEARDFVTKSAKEDVGICQAIGRFYAKQWLSEDYYKYVPTLFCFKIVQNVAFMSDERLWSQAQSRWSETPVRERVLKAIEWAGYPQTAHWHRRLGSTYLMLGLHSDALIHYHKALELDNNNSVGTAGRIAYCLSKYGQFGEALAQALKCAEIEERSIREGTLEGYALTSCRWRLYKDHLLIARCSYMTGKREAALEYFRKAIASAPAAGLNPSERFEAELSYLEMLATENLHSELVGLLQEMAKKASEKDKETTSLTNLLLDNCDKPLVLEWIPRAAVKVGQVAFILHQYEVAIETAHTIRNQMGVLYLRLAYGNTCAYNRDLDASIAIFEQISLIEYRPRGNVPTRHGHATSFQKLSALYKQKILQVELTSPEAAQWLDKLEQVQEKQSRHQNLDIPADKYGSDVNIASIYLALFHRLLKNELRARQLLGSLVINSLDILLDDEPRNDRYAADNLLQAFIAADDAENALALARSMRKVNRAAAAAATATTTPLSSPVRTRIEPKLPDIQAANKACAQCLDNISLSDNFYLCQLCVDAYCERCLHGVIQQPGNRTCDGRRDVVCRSDHAWFMVPPLNQFLHTGEILWGDGMVKSFIEWERALRQRWCDGT
ncbi:hypothetical protein BBK36DRAFT_1141724 [Trichoderma citrinoviride]|uniref:Fungal STAND N-terminal Goodbye domain-containing protein n=1 Tax=Trichoderma citrinoviride TaxID=58853 RepID=A0A2T4B8Y2_9HYPO|nr:hypothetical protein BBK36DRAFT_1141724 [Trichoderma citrinoviride]PTB65785.1 hypothetical protein BBK36DRAFT_1141724 [Trichoderma citrinoviride]